MKTIEFTIPFLPKPRNQLNVHWRVRHAEAKKCIELVCLHVQSKAPKKPFFKAKLTLIRYSSREPDFDGLVSSFKHIIDGLIHAGILENDKQENIGQPVYQWAKAKPKQGRIFVRIEGERIGARGLKTKEE